MSQYIQTTLLLLDCMYSGCNICRAEIWVVYIRDTATAIPLTPLQAKTVSLPSSTSVTSRLRSFRNKSQLFLDYNQPICQERHQIRLLLLRHFLVVLHFTQAAVNDNLEHCLLVERSSELGLAAHCCTRSRGTQESSRVCSTVRCNTRSRLDTSRSPICSHIIFEMRT